MRREDKFYHSTRVLDKQIKDTLWLAVTCLHGLKEEDPNILDALPGVIAHQGAWVNSVFRFTVDFMEKFDLVLVQYGLSQRLAHSWVPEPLYPNESFSALSGRVHLVLL